MITLTLKISLNLWWTHGFLLVELHQVIKKFNFFHEIKLLGEKEHKKKIESMSQKLFSQMDINKNGNITLEDFQICLKLNPDLLEIYETFNNGITDSIENPFIKTYDKKLLKISNIVDYMIIHLHQNFSSLLNLSKRLSSCNIEESNFGSENDKKTINNKSNFSLLNKSKLLSEDGFNPTTSKKIEPISFNDEEENFGKTFRKSVGKKIQTVIPKNDKNVVSPENSLISLELAYDQSHKSKKHVSLIPDINSQIDTIGICQFLF